MVVSALVLIFGLKSIGSLPVNQYPQTQNAIVTITTAYYGADPETIAGFITQPLEASIARHKVLITCPLLASVEFQRLLRH